MPLENYTEILKRFRQRINETEVLGNVMKQVAQEVDILKTFKTCLSVGTGYGEHDIDFIKICLPDLKKLIMVEMNPDCVKELKVNLKSAFGDYLEVEIHETTIENFMKTYKESNIDIAIAFHVIYPLKSEDLRSFLDSFFNSWSCNDNRLAIFVFNSMNDDLAKIARYIDPNVKPPQYLVKLNNETEKLGLPVKRVSYHKTVDLRNFDEDVFVLISSDLKLQVTREVLKEAIKTVIPDGWGSFSSEFCIITNHEL